MNPAEALSETKPDWSLLPFKHLQELPAIQWKLQNLSHLKLKNPTKFRLQREALEDTVDSFQGQERDIIAITLTCSNSQGEIGLTCPP